MLSSSALLGGSSLVNATQIAALADVRPSAVSNWRKRSDDFPKPVDSVPGGRDLFRLHDVEAWLEEHGKLREEGRASRLLFQAADLLRGELSVSSVTEALGAAFALVAAASDQGLDLETAEDLEVAIAMVEGAEPSLGDLFQPLLTIQRQSVTRVLGLVGGIKQAERPECFDWLLRRYNEQQGRSVHGSSEVQTALLSALTEGEKGVLYDPAAGTGGFLLATAVSAKAGELRVFGQEVNDASARIARQRFLVHRVPISMATGDTLSDDKWPDLKADLVVCDPPYKVKRDWPKAAFRDPRWMLGALPRTADFAWLQHALHHLAEDGRAYLFLPPSSLFSSGRERELRRDLLKLGVVEAVVSLPAGSSPHTGIPLVLWILRPAQPVSEQNSVLLVDPLASAGISRSEFVNDGIPQLAFALRGWRKSGELSKQSEGIAAAVPIAQLLSEEANLVPARWLHQDLSTDEREKKKKAAEQGLAALRKRHRDLDADLSIEVPSSPPIAGWTTIGRLVHDGVVEIVTGSPVKSDDFLSRGVRVFRPRDVSAVKEGTAVYVSSKDASRMAMTKAGDIIVSPVGGPVKAFVDHDGDHVLARPVQALRLRGDSMDPEVVAAFLESERNRRFLTGSTMPRVSVRDLEVPLLSTDDTAGLRRALDALREQEQVAHDIASSAQGLRRMWVDLASPGGVGVESESRRQWGR